jgi:hypothetical protein
VNSGTALLLPFERQFTANPDSSFFPDVAETKVSLLLRIGSTPGDVTNGSFESGELGWTVSFGGDLAIVNDVLPPGASILLSRTSDAQPSELRTLIDTAPDSARLTFDYVFPQVGSTLTVRLEDLVLGTINADSTDPSSASLAIPESLRGQNGLRLAFDLAGPLGDEIGIDNVALAPALPCPDLSDDGEVNSDDLFQLLGAWGPCADCPEDLTGDDAVNSDDLFELLGAWGPCD